MDQCNERVAHAHRPFHSVWSFLNQVSPGRAWRVVAAAALASATLLVGATTVSAAAISVISTNPGIVFHDIASDGSSLFVTGGSSVYTLPLAGGAASTLYTTVFPTGVTVIGSDVFWGDAQSGPITDSQILRAPKTGGGPVTPIYTGSLVGQPIVDIVGLETDGTKLYSADAVQGHVHSLNPNGSALTQIGPDRYGGTFLGAHFNSIAYGNGLVFVGESGVPTAAGCDGQCTPGVYSNSSSASGADPFSVVLGAPTFSGDGVRGVAFGQATVFVTQGDMIYLLDPGGGLTGALADLEFHDLRGITYDGGSLYVIDQFAGAARILRVDLAAVPLPGTASLLLVAACMLILMRIRRAPWI